MKRTEEIKEGTIKEAEIRFDRNGMHHNGFDEFYLGVWWGQFVDEEGKIHLFN